MLEPRERRLLCPGDCETTGNSPLTRRGIELTGIADPSIVLGRYSAASRSCARAAAERFGLDATSMNAEECVESDDLWACVGVRGVVLADCNDGGV